MRTIRRFDIDDLFSQARRSERKRAILRLHEHHEPVQRMVNALLPGTYVPPHKHENPDKVELFHLLRGKTAVLHFDKSGTVLEIYMLQEGGDIEVIEIPPRTYHALVPLAPSALLEIIEGPYEASTHKQFAPWAPLEDNPKAADYRMHLEAIVHNWGE